MPTQQPVSWCGLHWRRAARTTSPWSIFRIDELPDADDDEQTPGEHVLPAELWLGGASDDDQTAGPAGGGHALKIALGAVAGVALIAVVARRRGGRAALEPLRRCRRAHRTGGDLPGGSHRTAAWHQPVPRDVRLQRALPLAQRRPASAPVRPPAAIGFQRAGCHPAAGAPLMIRVMRTPRMRELVNLGYVGVLTAIGFLAVYTARQQDIRSTSLVYAGMFLATVRGRAPGGASGAAPRRPVAAAAGGADVGHRADRDLPARSGAGPRPVGVDHRRPGRGSPG